MRRTTLTLVNGKKLAGYEVGNFVVYEDYGYWHIAHKSGHTLLGDFKQLSDAVQACQTTDALANWDFDEQSQADLTKCRVAYDEACAQCISAGGWAVRTFA